jgi:hypothetical protein
MLATHSFASEAAVALRMCLVIGGLSLVLGGCSGAGSSQSNLSTASILGEAPPAASGTSPGITKEDPMARPVQVAWTSARAQRCGFNFDQAKLKANYIASEQRAGADTGRLGAIEKTYDTTVAKIKATIPQSDVYCTDKQSAVIKADLTRHLSGNYEPNFPDDKKNAEGGLFTKAADSTTYDRFDPKTIWRDLEDKKNGVRRSE